MEARLTAAVARRVAEQPRGDRLLGRGGARRGPSWRRRRAMECAFARVLEVRISLAPLGVAARRAGCDSSSRCGRAACPWTPSRSRAGWRCAPPIPAEIGRVARLCYTVEVMAIPNVKRFRPFCPTCNDNFTLMAVLPQGANVDQYLADAVARHDHKAFQEAKVLHFKVRVGQQKQKKAK